MIKRILSIPALVMVLFVLAVSPVAASSPPLDVDFEVLTTLPPPGGLSFGPFTATGPAVNAGLVCASGDTIDESNQLRGFQSGTSFIILARKMFTCDDGSGSFILNLKVRIDSQGAIYVHWNVLSGTGAYEKLHGTGTGTGIPLAPGTILDLYSGQIHID